MHKLTTAYWTIRALGRGNITRRFWQIFRIKTGILKKRLPGGELSSEQLRSKFVDDYIPQNALSYWKTRANYFFASSAQLPQIQQKLEKMVGKKCWDRNVTNVVSNLQQGHALFFSRSFRDVGWPPSYNYDPIHQFNWPVGNHWSTYVQFDPRFKDIKCVWELSRFSMAYYLAREYTRSGSHLAVDLFWQMFGSWDKQNPYGLTVQWACGQENTFRMMAWLFSAFVFLNDPQANAGHYHRLTELAWYTGRHLEYNVNYARSMKNNHVISEAVGLYTIGLLFPELRAAGKWKEKGRKILIDEAVKQIYDDGSYVQHSLNYHRVMLDDILWAARLSQLSKYPFPPCVTERLEKALHWLLAMIEPTTGRVPNYGPNDGANILPLCCCDYLDYRPVAQAVHYLLYCKRVFPPGPWDEKMLWLFGSESLESPLEPFQPVAHFAAPAGGYYVFRGTFSHMLTRCHTYRDRPSHADMLHVDLWYKGENVLRDAGTYMYYCHKTWQKFFSSTAAHNCVEIDGVDQMCKGPRFLWFRWTRSKLLHFKTSSNGQISYFEGEHFGYTRLPGKVIHRRSICRINNTYVIIDSIIGNCLHDITLRWRMHPADWHRDKNIWTSNVSGQPITLKTIVPESMSCNLVKGQENLAIEGWESLYYGDKTPSPTLIIKGHILLPVCMATIFSPAELDITVNAFNFNDPTAEIVLSGIGDIKIAECISQMSDGKFKFV